MEKTQNLKSILIISVFASLLTVGTYFFIAKPMESDSKDSFSFTSTAAWDPSLLIITQEATHYSEELFESVSLPPPTKNSSAETTTEIELLKSYVKLRTPQKLEDILAERVFATENFGGHTVDSYLDESKFPATSALLKDSMHDLDVIMLRLKKKFNRVRPNSLDPSLSIAIEVPGHPAYPSGHSSEMHFLAYVLSELAPARQAEFIARADEIAKNREIAGLHYPSDSHAGVLVAHQVFSILMQNSKFQNLLTAAKDEWRLRDNK